MHISDPTLKTLVDVQVQGNPVQVADAPICSLSTRPSDEIFDYVPPQIDAWLRENGLNRYGDPGSTVYLGGTPLFNEMTGRRDSRLGYILDRHPQLRSLLRAEGRCTHHHEQIRRQLGSGLRELMKKIEEIRAEIRKLWEALLRCGGTKKSKQQARRRIAVLEKILLLLYMKGGGQDSSGNTPPTLDIGGSFGSSLLPGTAIVPTAVTPPTTPVTTGS